MGQKVFAIMKHPGAHHDREGFDTPGSESFAILKRPIARGRAGPVSGGPLRVTAARHVVDQRDSQPSRAK
jgi:hypothetical protein